MYNQITYYGFCHNIQRDGDSVDLVPENEKFPRFTIDFETGEKYYFCEQDKKDGWFDVIAVIPVLNTKKAKEISKEILEEVIKKQTGKDTEIYFSW